MVKGVQHASFTATNSDIPHSLCTISSTNSQCLDTENIISGALDLVITGLHFSVKHREMNNVSMLICLLPHAYIDTNSCYSMALLLTCKLMHILFIHSSSNTCAQQYPPTIIFFIYIYAESLIKKCFIALYAA